MIHEFMIYSMQIDGRRFENFRIMNCQMYIEYIIRFAQKSRLEYCVESLHVL